MIRMDEDKEDLLDMASDTIGPSDPFTFRWPMGLNIALILFGLIVLYVTQHPHSFLARLFMSHH